MPYDPGVTDRSGEIFAHYLTQGVGTLAAASDQAVQEQRNRARAFDAIVNYGDATGLATKDELKPLSLEGAQSLVEGRLMKQRQQQQQQQTQIQKLQLDQMLGDQRIQQNVAGGGDPGAGVTAMSPAGAKMLAEGKYNRLSTAYEQPSSALSAVQAMNMGGNVDQAIQQPDVSPQLDANTAMRFARQAGLPVADQLLISRETKNLRQADSPEKVDTFVLPNGQQAAALRGSRQLIPLTDPNAPLPTEQIPDAAGNMHTIVRNPKTGAPMFVPAANTAQAQKLNVDSLVEAEKATRAIDDDIQSYHSQVTRSQKDPKVTAPNPQVLKDLQTRRKRLQGAIDSAADAPAEPASGAGKSAAEPAAAATVPPDVQALFDGANAAITKGANRAQVTARLNQELKKKGFSVRE